MTISTKTTLKTYFTTGATPSQQNFTDFIDSFLGIGETASQTIPSAIVVSGNTSMYGTATLGAAALTSWRSALGIGTAGLLNVGTGASQVVQLTVASKLPAVDGSLLTNIPTGMTLLVSAAVAGALMVDFTTNIDGTYASYKIIGSNITMTSDGANLLARIQSASSFLSDAHYDYVFSYIIHGVTLGAVDNTAATSWSLDSSIGTSNTNPKTLEFSFSQPQLAAQFQANWVYPGGYSTFQPANINGTGRHSTNAAAVTGIRFLPSTSTFATGTFKLYGIL